MQSSRIYCFVSPVLLQERLPLCLSDSSADGGVSGVLADQMSSSPDFLFPKLAGLHLTQNVCSKALLAFWPRFWFVSGALRCVVFNSVYCKAAAVVVSDRGSQGRGIWLLLNTDPGISCPSGRNCGMIHVCALFVQCTVVSVFDP